MTHFLPSKSSIVVSQYHHGASNEDHEAFTKRDVSCLHRDGIVIPQCYSLREENESLGNSSLLTDYYSKKWSIPHVNFRSKLHFQKVGNRQHTMKGLTSHDSLVTTPKQEVHSLEGPPEARQKIPSDKEEFTTKLIGWILQGGVMLSASIILIGFIMLPLRPGGFSVHRFLSFPQTLSQVWAGLLVLHPQAIIALGLLLLIATPVMRVAVSIVAFALERDHRSVVITVLVLAILLLSNVLLGTIVGSTSHTNLQHLYFSLAVVLLIFVGSVVAGFVWWVSRFGVGWRVGLRLARAFRLSLFFFPRTGGLRLSA